MMDPTAEEGQPVGVHRMAKDLVNGNPLEQIERLLTCPICLDRYKQPKLLSCQHTFCFSCLESYVDSSGIARPRIRCPECRSETALEAGSVQSLQTNLTLMSFLEIHLEASDVNAAEMQAYAQRFNMERCRVCEEKAELEMCAHCERKCCAECRTAHVDMLKRDLGRLLGQVRRLSARVMDASKGLSRGLDQLAANGEQTKSEIRDYFNRYQKELRRREDTFIEQVEVFVQTEDRLMRTLRDALDVEWNNLQDACLWVDAALGGEHEVRDDELARYKTVFAQGLEYLRSFQPDSEDLFAKKVRFSPGDDAAKLPTAIANFGELNVSLPQFANRYLPLEQQYLPRPFRLGFESEHFKRMTERDQRGGGNGAERYRGGGGEEEEGSGRGGGSGRQRESAGAQRWRRRRELEEEAWSRLRVSESTGSAWTSSGRGTPSGALSPLTVPTATGAGGSASPMASISPATSMMRLASSPRPEERPKIAAVTTENKGAATTKSEEMPKLKSETAKAKEAVVVLKPKLETPQPAKAEAPKSSKAEALQPAKSKAEAPQSVEPKVTATQAAEPNKTMEPVTPKREAPKPKAQTPTIAPESKDVVSSEGPTPGESAAVPSKNDDALQATSAAPAQKKETAPAQPVAAAVPSFTTTPMQQQQMGPKNGKAEGSSTAPQQQQHHRGRLVMVNGGGGSSASGSGNKATTPRFRPLGPAQQQ